MSFVGRALACQRHPGEARILPPVSTGEIGLSEMSFVSRALAGSPSATSFNWWDGADKGIFSPLQRASRFGLQAIRQRSGRILAEKPG
jgi:hypothetical protein